MALPIGLLMIAGQLDISVGAVIPASSMTAADPFRLSACPISSASLADLGVGLAVGFVNGFLVTRTKIPSLIVTIGTMFGVMGLTLGLTVLIAGSDQCVFMVPDPATKLALGPHSSAACSSVSIFWWLLFVVALVFLLHALSDRELDLRRWAATTKARAMPASRPTRLTIALYMLSGFAAAFVGI